MLADAEHETLASLVWRELVRDAPDYEPARKNLVLVGSQISLVAAAIKPADLPATREVAWTV